MKLHSGPFCPWRPGVERFGTVSQRILVCDSEAKKILGKNGPAAMGNTSSCVGIFLDAFVITGRVKNRSYHVLTHLACGLMFCFRRFLSKSMP